MSQTASGGVSINPTTPNRGVGTTPSLDLIYAPVRDQLSLVEKILHQQLTCETPFVDQLLEHTRRLGGKRIRPLLLLLSGASVGQIRHAHCQLAAALEMIHTATLVHDDILDEAQTRRHRPTANTLWGTKQGILLGDFLFTHAFHVASEAGSVEALRLLAMSSNRVCEGEMRQNAWQGEFDLSEAQYLQMISEKTAELCSVACRLGATLSEADQQSIERLHEYGRNLGVAFQIIDDVLDIVGTPASVGKTLGTDLVNQKPTLPIIHAMENLATDRQAELRAFLTESLESTTDLVEFLNESGSIDYSRKRARDHAQQAIELAQALPESEHAEALIQLAKFVLMRTH